MPIVKLYRPGSEPDEGRTPYSRQFFNHHEMVMMRLALLDAIEKHKKIMADESLDAETRHYAKYDVEWHEQFLQKLQVDLDEMNKELEVEEELDDFDEDPERTTQQAIDQDLELLDDHPKDCDCWECDPGPDINQEA